MGKKQNDADRLPPDTYHIVLTIAKSYYTLLQRRRVIDDAIARENHRVASSPGSGPGDSVARRGERMAARRERNELKIKAIENAWQSAGGDIEREVIEKNLFLGLPMSWIDAPMSERSMQRVRRCFLYRLAQELGEL